MNAAEHAPVAARAAASVMLLRTGAAGLEVFLQRRAAAMAFAPDVTAFPGGGVDHRDRRPPARWHGPAPRWWAERLGCCSEELATALVCAAVRETFEECGVLLAADHTGAPIEISSVEMAAARRRMVEERLPLAELLDANQWAVRAESLRPWANWITPQGRPRRYDTRFFVAALPDNQRADDSTTEVAAVQWARPTAALAASARGTLQLMLPTRSCLEDLAKASDVAGALLMAEKRPIWPIMAHIEQRDGREIVTVPPPPADLKNQNDLTTGKPSIFPTPDVPVVDTIKPWDMPSEGSEGTNVQTDAGLAGGRRGRQGR